ncbi:DUF4870 family protein [Alkanindiges sp. WGS2144]|uniref:DUF4870 family protein n=1 Tax=Alkanindiges sp. WGS2144 TaxID=3366808 RepID=UPI0037511A39
MIQDSRYQSQKNLTMVLYVLYLSAIVTAGILAVVALIINYAKRRDVQGTLFESHFSWQIRTFWWYLFWNMAAFVPLVFIFFSGQNESQIAEQALGALGFCIAVILLSWFWVLYRAIRGLLALSDNKPMQ